MKKRLYFIDIVRAFAILMMLQGHFIDTLLEASYRNPNAPIFSIWSFFRGITAPVFFSISGLIFGYLLLRAQQTGTEKFRMKRGLSRGLSLIAIGYLIRIDLLNWVLGFFDNSFLAVDVLQCIGLSGILTVGLFVLCRKNSLLVSVSTFIVGNLIFLLEPCYRTLSLENLPVLIGNYLSKDHGSVFTIIPWYGYYSLGVFTATLFNGNLHKKYFKRLMISVFLGAGLLLIAYSSSLLEFTSQLTGLTVLSEAAQYNYLYTKLGYAFLYFAFFYCFENHLKHPLVLKIGKNTLSIYVLHFIILYGDFFNLGLKNIGSVLSPVQAGLGALLFIVLVLVSGHFYFRASRAITPYFYKLTAFFKQFLQKRLPQSK